MSSLISRISLSSISRAGRLPPVVVTVRLVSDRIWFTWRSSCSVESRSSSVIGCLRPRSTEPTGDVVLGQLLAGVGEDLERRPDLDEVAGSVVAHREEGRPVAAQPLLLAARQCEPGLAPEVVLDLLPDRRPLERLLDDLIDGGAALDA